MLVLMLMVGGSAKADATLGSKLTSLDQLSNGKFYAIHNTNNEGFWCYNQTVNQNYLSITGVTNDGSGAVSNAAANAAYHAAYDVADVNGQWQIIQFNGVFYVYNVGAQKYLTRSGRDYQLTETATAIDGIKVVSEGVFAFHAGGGMSDGSQNYACIVTNTTPQAVRNWTYSDHGSKMWISEIEGLEEDLTVANTLEEVAKQAARTTAFNELLGNVKTAYNGNFTYTKGADIITDANWFSSNATEPNEGKITNLIDNDCTTFWHSSWSATNGAAVAFHNHYLQVSLPDAIEGQTQMTMGRRVNEGAFCDDNPVRMSVTFSADDATYSEPTYFDTPFNQTIEDPYVKATFDVPAGTKFLRFYNEQSNGSNQRGYWHCGEFQLNPVTLDAECANATHPNATAAMLAAIEAAEGIDAATVTEAQLEALQTAYDTYVAALEQPEGGEEGSETLVHKFVFASVASGTTDSSTSWTGSSAVDRVFESGYQDENGEQLIDMEAANKAYAGKPTMGLKLSSASVGGGLRFTLRTPVKATKAVIEAAPYNETEGRSFTFNAQTVTMGDAPAGVHAEYTVTLDGGDLEEIELAAMDKRIYIKSVSLYVGSDEPESKTVDVTYTVKFGEQTLKTETITETVGEAPTFALEAPAYVTVSGMPETIAEETTEVTVETALNEQAPFAVGSTYNFFFHPNGNRYFWKDNGETDAREEFVTTDYVYYNAADAAKYEWTVGGDWMNGFTFVNANGNYINAPEGVAASSRAQLTAEATTKYVLVANGEKWHVAIKGNEGIFLAHVGHNGGNPYLQFWNVADYNGGDLYVTEPLSQTSTKTVTITFVTSTGTKYMLNNNEGTLNTIAYTAEAPASAQFEATLWSNDKYTYKQGELYLGYHRLDAELKSNLNFFTVATLEGVTNNFITTDVPAGTVYLAVENRAGGDAQAGVLILKEADQTFAATGAPFFNGVYTSAMLVEEYTAPVVQPINLEKVYLQSKTGQYFGIAGGQVTVAEEPYAMTFTAIEGQENAYSFRNYDNTHWINSGSNGWLSTAAISQTNNIRNYYFYEATITETGVKGTLVAEPVKGKEYMVVVKNINSGNHAGLYALYCGTASSNSERFDVVKITSDNSVIPAEFTLTSENKHDADIKNSKPGSALEDFKKVVWNIVEPSVPSSYEYTVAISGAPEEAEVYVTVEGDETHYTNGQTVTTTTELTAEQVSAAEVEGYVAEVTVENNTITVVYAEPKPEFPVEGKAYVVKNVESQLFLNVIEHEAKATVLGTQPEKFFFTKKDGAWVIKNEEGLYVGGHSNTWNMSSSVEQLWKVVEVEGGYAFERADAAGKYIGFNNLTVDPDDATKTAAYRDKNYASNHGVFTIFEYTFPLQGEAYKVKNVDAGMYINLSDKAVKNTTLEKTAEKLFFTVAEEGGFYIQDEDGNYLGASEEGKSDFGWNTGNVKNLTWNIVEVEGGYAIQRVSNKAKHLGSDTVGEHGDLFTDKGISAHGVYLIMLFDTPETTPLEDLQAAIEAAKAIKAEDYATVPADLFEDLANEIEKAEALAAKGENAAVYEINEELAALEAAVKAITEYTEPTVDELTARLAAALTAANAAVAENYSEEVLMAGKPGYKAAELVVALEEAVATYTDFAGELTRDIVVEVEHAVRAYNEASICLPEVGKTYTIRNHTAGLRAEFGYYLSASNNILISSDGFTPGATEQWTVSEYDLLVEDDWGDPLFSEKRHVFTNKETGTMLGWNGSALGTCEGDPSNYTCWNYITTNPREHYADPSVKDMPYGTLGLQFYNGASYYRVATVWMRVDSLSFQGGDLHMHGLWSAYSSFYIFDEVDPSTVGVGTVLAPTSSERIYNLQGKMQNRLQRGINVVNGKKVLR